MEQPSQEAEAEIKVAEHQPLLQQLEEQLEAQEQQSQEALAQQPEPQSPMEPPPTVETTTQHSLDESAEVSVVSSDGGGDLPGVTPSAVTNIAETAANTVQTVIERGSSLLREWDSGNAPQPEPATSIGSPLPVVAPAVVLNETSEDSNATPTRGGVYPVATFVSNLVRTSVNEIRSHIPGANDADTTLSLRSEPVGSMDHLLNTTSNHEPPPPTSVADSSMDQEFVLIDGDLVAIPASHHAPPPTPAPAQARRQYSQSENNIHHRLIQEQNSWNHPPNEQQQQHQQQHQQQQASNQQPQQQQQLQQYYPPSDTDQTSYYTDSSYDHRHTDRFSNPRFSGGASERGRDYRSHKGGKMTRSMRGIKKWIKKKSRRSTKNFAQDEFRQSSMTSGSRPSSSRHLMTSDDDDSIIFTPQIGGPNIQLGVGGAVAAAGTSAYGNRFEDDQSVASSFTANTASAPSPTRRIAESKKKKKNRFELKKLKKQDKHSKMMLGTEIPPSESMPESQSQSQSQPTQASITLAPPTTLDSMTSVASVASSTNPSVASIPAAASSNSNNNNNNSSSMPMSIASMPSVEEPAAAPAQSAAAAVARMTPPPPMPSSSSLYDNGSMMMMTPRMASIAAEASFVGNLDQLAAVEVAGVMDACVAEAYIEDRLDDYDKYYDDDDEKKKHAYYPKSMVPKDADFKVDKMDAPNVESMLQRAGEFARDLENSVLESFCIKPAPPGPPGGIKKIVSQGKSDGGSVPLSMATLDDGANVHNDILKIVMVGAEMVDKQGLTRTLRNKSQKKKASSRKRTNTLGVDVHSWTPVNDQNAKFTIWTVRGNGTDPSDPYNTNFGAHPGTQSLFFSDRSLYLLVWDLAANNEKTYRRQAHIDESSDSDSSDEDDDYPDTSNAYLREEANRQADRNLHTDIEERVLSWVDCIGQRGAHSAVLPVALVPSNMSPEETKRRCDVLQKLLLEHTDENWKGNFAPPKVLSGAETVHCVSLDTNMGIDLLEETIVAIANDVHHSVFDHVGTPVPKGTVQVLETSKRLKEADQKLVSLDLLMSELPSEEILSVREVMEALEFLSSVGELFYFGTSANISDADFDANNILTQFVILSRKWLVSALSCILRNDLQRELNETRRFMNMQLLYSNQRFPENQAIQTLSSGSSSCPLLSSSDTEMLWQSMSFMREAADKSDQLSEHSTTCATMFGFLETLLVHTGIFLPLDIDRFAVTDYVYFVPSLLANGDAKSVWTYKSSEAYMTTLCHSWLFRDGAAVDLMEQVTVALLRDLYEFTHVVAASTPSEDVKPASNHGITLNRAQSFPFSQSAANDFIGMHDGDAIGGIRIHQVNCWKSSLLVKIGCVFPEGNELRESVVEIFVSITDQFSPLCVSSDAMGARMQRLIVSGKGQVGHHGRKLWKGGYGIVMDSIKASVAHCTNVDRQVVCPECLAHVHPSGASTWSWDSVRAAAGTVVRCMKGHRVDSNLISGIPKVPSPKLEVANHHSTEMPKKTVKDLLPSVVVVGLWDCESKVIRNVGSGFFVDRKLGLVITAGHILFQMEAGPNFGIPYFGLANAKVVIGIIREGADSSNACFRYFAEIVAEDIHNVDACVLRITSRMEEDVDNEALLGQQPEISMKSCIAEENLPALKLTRRYELEETIRILGYNQGGEGRLEQGKHVNRSADFAKGYICKQFKMLEDDNSDSDDESSCGANGFSPREEVVIMCPTISGHSGGPCVNDEGKVIGILSRADPVDRQRCYLAPTNELKSLVNKAKKYCARATGGLKAY